MKQPKLLVKPSQREVAGRQRLFELFNETPVPEEQLPDNLGLYLRRQALSRILFMHELYRKILDVHGVIMELGVHWGQNLALYESFRGMYEPYNHTRKIIGFDTFAGFPSVDAKDGAADIVAKGSFAVSSGYQDHLQQVLEYHETESPIAHLRKFELVKGDASLTVPNYLKDHPETIVALAYFDFDIYEPTRRCLEAIKPRLTKGSVVGFDELNHPEFPGETVAVMEALGLSRHAIRRCPYNSTTSYLVVD